MNEFKSVTNSANGPIISTYYAQSELSSLSIQYVDTKTMPVEECFPATKQFVDNYKKSLAPVPVPKYWLGFSYISSKCYDSDVHFDET